MTQMLKDHLRKKEEYVYKYIVLLTSDAIETFLDPLDTSITVHSNLYLCDSRFLHFMEKYS